MNHSHPRLDFPLYGLPSSCEGARWLEFIEGQVGDPVWAAWLAHAPRRGPYQWCLIGTLPTSRSRAAPAVTDPELVSREVAFTAARWLLGVTNPGNSLDEAARQRYLRNSVPFLTEQAKAWTTWSPATWSVDNRQMQARVLRWAGAWAGFTTDLPDAALIVITQGLSADNLDLVRVDPSAYHFAVESPIDYPTTLQQDGAALPPGVLAQLGQAGQDDVVGLDVQARRRERRQRP